MRISLPLSVLAIAASSVASAAPRESWQSQVIGAPPSQPYASSRLYSSGNECAPDRAEAEWDRNYKFLGYACVRTGPSR